MGALKSKMGPVLFQLPPNWHVNLDRLQQFLPLLASRRHQYVVEFRDPTWYTNPVYELLRKNNIALCVHDWGGHHSPQEITADFTYVRFHGATGKYQGNYSEEMLQAWASRISNWSPTLSAIYLYFNNDAGGHAVTNAQLLQSWFSEPRLRIA